MHGKKLINNIFTAWLIFVFVFCPFKFNSFDFSSNQVEAMEKWVIDQDMTWKKDENILVDKWVVIKNGATLTIEKGATIRFANSNDADAYTPTIQVEDGRILAEGTHDEKITFIPENEEDQYGIIFCGRQNSKPSLFRYVNFEKGGYRPDYILYNNKNDIFSKAYAFGQYEAPVIYYFFGKVHFENSEFKNSFSGDIEINTEITEDSQGDYFEVVNSNFKNSGNNTAIYSNIYCDSENYDECFEKNKRVLLKNNFYDDFQGPTEEGDLLGKGEKIIGDYLLDGYRNNDSIADPVILIPGIMGSAQVFNEWKIDPILHTYDNLASSFKINGYEKNKNIFEFPYDWRNSNEISANYLQAKVEGVINETRVSKVDLVAHSMGGLVARAYIEETADNIDYNDTVDQLITLGTPHKGAPKAYLYWEAGEGFFGLVDAVIKHHFTQEGEHLGYDNLYSYIQNRVVSIKELLPDYDYLRNESDGEMRNYYENYPRNVFMEELDENTDKLKSVNFTNIIGKLSDSESTISEIRVGDVNDNGTWKHGMPENFVDDSTDQGLNYSSGDKTVPLYSAESIDADNEIKINSSHSNLPTEAQCKIISELTQIDEDNCEYVDDWHMPNLLLINVFSPIDIQVEAPDGKKIGKDFETGEIINEIDGAYYTGYETDNEFLTIPNPEDGEYKILTQGTGEGEYKIEAAKISEDENNPGQTIESSKDIIGTAEAGSREEKSVQVLGNEVLAEAKDTTPPDITYVVSPSPNENGWNNTDVKVHFEAADGESGMDENNASRDIILEGEGGNQSASWTTADKAGNSATKNISGINIDKTAPVTEINFSGTEGKNDWYASDVSVSFSSSDNLSGTEKTFYALDNQDFQAGNQLAVTDEGEHSLKYYSQDLAGNIENINLASFKLDKTAPAVKIISPENKSYPNDAFLEIKYDIEDSVSPPDKIQKTISYDDQIINSDKIDLALEHLGNHSLAISAEDEAGNQNEARISFTVTTDINSIISNVKHYFQLGLIKSRTAEIALEVKLRNIKSKTRLLNIFESRWMPKWAKDKVVANLKREINRQIDDLINQIRNNKTFYKNIDQKVAGILIESLNSVKQ